MTKRLSTVLVVVSSLLFVCSVASAKKKAPKPDKHPKLVFESVTVEEDVFSPALETLEISVNYALQPVAGMVGS